MRIALLPIYPIIFGGVIAYCSAVATRPAAANTLAPQQHLKIILEYDQGRKYAPKTRKAVAHDWLNVCKSLAAALRIGNTYHGYGIFKSFSCVINKTLVKGVKQPTEFELRVRDTPTTVSMNLLHALFKNSDSGSLEQWQQEASISFAGSEKTIEMLQDKDFSHLVGFALLNSLPMQIKLESPEQDHFALVRNAQPRWPLPPPPQKFDLLQLGFSPSSGMWNADALGEATQEKSASAKGHVTYSYKIKKNAVAAHPKLGLWVRSSGERASNYKEVNELIKKASNELIGNTIDDDDSPLATLKKMIPGGYVGLRYGFPLFRTGLFVSKVHTFGLLTEVRSGFFNGLRFYYELTPQVRETYLGEDLTYRSSRAVLGWSFGINPQLFISRIDVVPKIGQWTFNVDIPVAIEGSDEILVKKFKIDTALSLGVESGLEMTLPFILTRLWAGFDQSLNALKSAGSQGTVSSRRYGIDGIVNGPSISHFVNIDFLAFALQESVVIKQSNVEKDDDGLAIKGISYVLRTAGLGITLSW